MPHVMWGADTCLPLKDRRVILSPIWYTYAIG